MSIVSLLLRSKIVCSVIVCVRPAEMSAKIPVSRYRVVVRGSKQERRDPRFDDQCGEFSESVYRKTYSFLDDYKQKEMEDLRKAARKTRNEEQKKMLQTLAAKYVSLAFCFCSALPVSV